MATGSKASPEPTRAPSSPTRIIDAGGRVDLIALDEPYYFVFIYDGEQACNWDSGRVASEVGEFVSLMRGFFPDIVIGDTEPTPLPTTTGTYTAWLETFREVNRYDLGFLHLDIDWSRDDWPETAQDTVEFGQGLGVPVGIIFAGNHADPSDDRWLAMAGETAHRIEGWVGGSWTQLDGFIGNTSDGAPIERTPAAPWQNVERLRVETVAGPSWVAWYEIEVVSGP